MSWLGGIFDARESKSGETPSEGYDGNYTYSNGTYGQSDYTVRERQDGSGYSDVYTTNDDHHTHDVIDRDGNLIESYHDYLISRLSNLTNEQLIKLSSMMYEDVIQEINNSQLKLRLK